MDDLDAIPAEQWRWPNFSADEFRSRGSGEAWMNLGFMHRLQGLREAFGRPMVISSGYRDPDYNERVSTTGKHGPHTTGHAADVLVSGAAALDLVRLALERGFTGIGAKQHGDYGRRFVHLDDLPAGVNQPRPHLWTYG